MNNVFKILSLFAIPFLQYQLFGKIQPMLAGFKVTHRCNLKCTHCPYWKRPCQDPTFDDVLLVLDKLRSAGARILIIEGGEPMLWRSGNYDIRDLINAARNRFSSVCMTTNGTIDWSGLKLDQVWVSIDGPEEMHDAIRGRGTFRKVLNNIQKAKRKVYVSTTISSINCDTIVDMIKILKDVVGGITIQFYYPYNGLPDPLFISHSERVAILDDLLQLKKEGYPVANSSLSLNDLKNPHWTCLDGFLINANPDGTIEQGCYLKNRGASDCIMCGFAAHNEMSLAFKMRPESIICGMRTFFS